MTWPMGLVKGRIARFGLGWAGGDFDELGREQRSQSLFERRRLRPLLVSHHKDQPGIKNVLEPSMHC